MVHGCPWGVDFTVRGGLISNDKVLGWSDVFWGNVNSSHEILGQDNVAWDVGLEYPFQEGTYLVAVSFQTVNQWKHPDQY